MKYSLRSLMIVVTLAGVVLGGRIEYLRRWATYHEREAERIRRKLAPIYENQKCGMAFPLSALGDALEEDGHREMGEAFRRASYRPWTVVNAGPAGDWAYSNSVDSRP